MQFSVSCPGEGRFSDGIRYSLHSNDLIKTYHSSLSIIDMDRMENQ